MAKNQLADPLDLVVENFTDSAIENLKEQGRAIANDAIKSISKRVQKEFINHIENKALRQAASGTLKKLSNVDGFLGAFNSIQGNSGLLNQTFSEIGRDIENFIGGQMDHVELMESLADRAERYISDTVKKMATVSAAEFGLIAPAIGKMAGYIAGSMFRDAVAPFVERAKRSKIAQEKHEQLHGLYEEAILQMQEQRQLFERETSALFARRQALIDDCFSKLDTANSVKDVNKAAIALGAITTEFGGTQRFKTVDEFEDFLLNSDEDLIV